MSKDVKKMAANNLGKNFASATYFLATLPEMKTVETGEERTKARTQMSEIGNILKTWEIIGDTDSIKNFKEALDESIEAYQKQYNPLP